MPFTTVEKRIVPGHGPSTANMIFVGEAPGLQEERIGRPFVGPAGGVLEQCMHNAGVIRAECYLTNVVKERPPNNKIDSYFTGTHFTPKGQVWVDRLRDELKQLPGNLIIPAGRTALSALTGNNDIMKRRGYVTFSTLIPGRKVLPIIHPSAALRGNYLYRYFITRDLRKAKLQSRTASPGYPVREPSIPISVDDAIAELQCLQAAKRISCDIEVANDQVSCIGFCDEDTRFPVTIPFYGPEPVWSELEEVQIWNAIADLLESDKIEKVFQNGIFDISFLFMRNRILTRGHVQDTMVAHSVAYPEFPKSLAFLASIYTNQPYWKDMVKWKGEKKDA